MNPRDIGLKLFSSRSPVEIGEPWEIILEITNFSNEDIWISNITTSLSLTAEIRPPSERKVAGSAGQLPSVFAGPGADTVKIGPAGTYNVIWRQLEDDDSKSFARNLLWEIFFQPGIYRFFAEIHIWSERPDHGILYRAHKLGRDENESMLKKHLFEMLESSSKNDEESLENEKLDEDTPAVAGNTTSTEDDGDANYEERMDKAKEELFDLLDKSTTLTCEGQSPFAIKSTTIFLGALLGALFAFLLRQLQLASLGEAPVSSDFWLLPLYCITSVIVVLLLARVNEAKIPFTIRVMDFWGACALGVLGAFVGQFLLARLLQAMVN